MDHTIDTFLSQCSGIDFGRVRLSEDQQRFYHHFNSVDVSLCASLPESVQEEALRFLKRYYGVGDGKEPDFFKNYYAPSWSVIYWLVHYDRQNIANLSDEVIMDAVCAHAMAMNLHSLDDRLYDGVIPTNHLTLLLRSQSWVMMNASWSRLGERVDDGPRHVRDFINDYYSGIHNPEAPASLDGFCDRFRKQMATWVISPVLISELVAARGKFTIRVQNAYESFGIAWRLIDDINDIGHDMTAGAHSAIYYCLPGDMRRLWDELPSKGGLHSGGISKQILDYLVTAGVVDIVRERVVRELENAASVADSIHLSGLGNEFRELLKPLNRRDRLVVVSANVADYHHDFGKKTVSIEVTTHCNAKCTHCFVRAAMKKPTSLSPGVVREIISEGYDLGYRNLHLTGGEPLLWEGLFDALDVAFKRGYESVFLNTNGTLLTKAMASQFASYERLELSVSLEGRESLHDDIRGKGAYRQAMLGIGKALEAGVELCVFTTIRKRLLPYLPYFIDEVYERFPGIDHLALIQLTRVKDDVFDLSEELLTPDDFIRVVQAASLLNLYGHKVTVLNNPLVNVTAKKMGIWGIPLSAPLRRDGDFIVMADQNIACAHFTDEHLGKFKAGTTGKILSSTAYRSAVAPDVDTCPYCPHNSLCRENGMIRPSMACRDMLTDEPFCRRVVDRAEKYC